MKQALTTVFLGLVMLFSPPLTHAELPPGPHFTFTVPVHLANLPPEISQYTVTCSVGTARSLTMASGSVHNPITGGAVNTEVAVNVTVDTRRDPFAHPANATNYRCNLKLDNGSTIPYLQYLPDSGVANFPLASGAPFIYWAMGTIP